VAASNMKSAFPVNGSHFFLDIGLGRDWENGGFSRTKHLEESGWRGVCANPFPDEKRSCKAIAVPVAPTSGQKVEVSDCNGFANVLSMFAGMNTECPRVEKAGVSIGEVLSLAKAPHVIDYFALDSQGTELEILGKFPFKQFCVRAWTVQHRYEADTIAGIQKFFSAHGCKVKDAGPAFWARCSCSKFPQSLLTLEENPAQKYIDILRRKTERRLQTKYGERQRKRVLAPSEQTLDMGIEFDAASRSLMRKN